MAGTNLVKTEGRKRGTDPNKLNSRHKGFADEWIANGMNGSAAASKMGFSNPAVMANRLLNNPKVRSYLEKKLSDITENRTIRVAQLLNKMRRISEFNLMRAASTGASGYITISAKDYERVSDEIGDCITEVETETTEDRDGNVKSRIRIKIMSKERMHELEMKYYGMLTDKVDTTHKVQLDWDDLAKSNGTVNGEVSNVVVE